MKKISGVVILLAVVLICYGLVRSGSDFLGWGYFFGTEEEESETITISINSISETGSFECDFFATLLIREIRARFPYRDGISPGRYRVLIIESREAEDSKRQEIIVFLDKKIVNRRETSLLQSKAKLRLFAGETAEAILDRLSQAPGGPLPVFGQPDRTIM